MIHVKCDLRGGGLYLVHAHRRDSYFPFFVVLHKPVKVLARRRHKISGAAERTLNVPEMVPRQLLPCEDLKDEATGRYVGENCMELVLPERGVRFVSLKLEAWDAAVEATFAPASRRAGLQKYRETWATPDAPVIVEGVHRLFVHGLPSGNAPMAAQSAGEAGNVPPYRPLPPIESLMMVAAPADGAFVLDPSLLRYGEMLVG